MLFSFLSILVFATLAYGMTRPVAQLVVGVGCLLLLLVLRLRLKDWYRVPGTLPLLLLVVFWMLQLVPLPPVLLKLLVPATAGLYADSIWRLSPDAWMPLSQSPHASLVVGLQWVAAAALYVAAVQFFARQKNLQRTVVWITGFAGVYALLAICYSLFPTERILWVLLPWPYGTAGFGSYVNPNHYAGLMGMLLPLAVVLFLLNRPQTSYGNLKERLIDFFSDPRTSPHLLYGLGAMVIALSIFLSLSRGGILCTLGGLSLLGGLIGLRGQDWRRGGLLLGFVCLLLLMVGMFGWQPIFDEFESFRNRQGEIAERRPELWQACLPMVTDNPLFGTGIGSFLDAYPPYQEMVTHGRVAHHAHNDFIELVTDAGLIGAVLVGWFIVAVWRPSWAAVRRRRSRFSHYLFYAAAAGAGSIFLHSFVDFNLRIGANLLYLALLMAILVSAGHSRSSGAGKATELPRANSGRIPWACGIVLLLVVSLGFNGGRALAGLNYPSVATVDLNQVEDDVRMDALSVSRFAASVDPLSSRYRYAMANALLSLGRYDEALEKYREAIRRRPVRSEFLLQMARLLDFRNRKVEAESLFRAAVRHAPTNPQATSALASWLAYAGRVAESQQWFHKSMLLDPQRSKEELQRLSGFGVSDPDLRRIVPDKALPRLQLAAYLEEKEAMADAEAVYRDLLELIPLEDSPISWAYRKVADFFARQKRWAEALQIIEAGLLTYPDDPWLYRSEGIFSLRLGLTEKAREALAKTVLLNPTDKWARDQLKRLDEGR